MTAVKSFALGALVIGTVAHSTLAGPVRSANLRWLGWSNHGEVSSNPPAPVLTPTPIAAPVPMPVAPPSQSPTAPVWQASSYWSTEGGNVINNVSPPQAFFAPALSPAVVSFSPTTFNANGSGVATPAGIQPAPAAASNPAVYDAFVNLTDGRFAEATNLTTGAPSAWYNSPVAAQVFGGVPNAQQRSDFTASVLANVQHTFDLAGVPVHLTADPNAPAAHTLSVVSGVSYLQNPATIGITDVGQNGFDFIDKLTNAQTPDQLALAVAHNVSHELMHAFGIAVHHDTTGNFIDAGSASWSLLTSPSATFSPDSIQDLLTRNFSAGASSGLLGGQGQTIDGEQTIGGVQTVPEPTTIVLWLVVGGLGVARARRRMAA